MKLYLCDNNKITSYNLPPKALDDFVINYKSSSLTSNVLITINAKDNNWFFKNNTNISITNFLESEVELELYCCYKLKISGKKDILTMVILPLNEHLYKLKINNLNKINIGKDSKNIIKYNSEVVADVQAEINLINNEWFIQGLDNDFYPLYINRERKTKKQLNIGDIIFIFGLKIVWMKNFIIINNPLNKVVIQQMSLIENNNENKLSPVSDEERYTDLYSLDEYFYHTPRIREKITEKVIVIDAPPSDEKKENIPFILTIGSSVVMMSSTFMMSYNVVINIMDGKNITRLIPQIVMMLAMLIGSLLIPTLSRRYQKKQAIKKSKLRNDKYSKYLDTKIQELNLIMKENVRILRDTYLSNEECENIIRLKQDNLWCREVTDDDFLVIRIGIGEGDSHLKIEAPEEHFTLDEDKLLQKVYQVVKNYHSLEDVPVTVSIKDNPIISFLFNCNDIERYINGFILQLMALHSPSDLNIIIFTDEEQINNWNYLKILPHCFSDDKKIRFFASNVEDAKIISNHLMEIMQDRKEKIKDKKDSSFLPYYMVITDNYKRYQNVSIIQEIINQEQSLGISLVCLDSSIQNVPKNSTYFINVEEKNGSIINRDKGTNSKKEFKCEPVKNLNMELLSTKLANIPIQSKEANSTLPTVLPFLEMFSVSKIEQLNILKRWNENNPVITLDTPVGVHADGDLFMLNLHEKYHGPHGLVAGMTGSGKSEFIITYILSMAVNFHPYEVQFVLIDYKGGGLAGAFENRETNVVLPHLAGTITNLDTSEMNRTLVSIQSELKRRQRVFNEVRDQLNESTIDIYKYQKLYREGVIKEPMAHLFIISDEFAELKQQQPDFMQQLISTARIGRSLGVHLILATQKPSGVVNDQIWSNAKFKVCLKVQNRSDSMEMLKKPDAASIKETGRFYLQVGYDDYFEVGQSAWSGAKYYPSDQIIMKIDESINFINEVGYVIKSSSSGKDVKNIKDSGEQLTNLVKYLADLGKRENIKRTSLWLEAIPPIINVNELKRKYNYKPKPYIIAPVIGEYDEPENQRQGLVNLDLTNVGNTAIFGIVGSGKEELIKTILWSTIVEHTPDEVNIYILDFGSGTLKSFKNMPHVGDVVLQDEVEKVKDFFQMIDEEIENRKDIFSDYAGSYTEYLDNSGKKLPLIEVIINQYESFCEANSRLSEQIMSIYRDGPKYGIIFILTSISTSGIRGRMLQNFNNKICLQLPNETDYRNVINTRKKIIPARFSGRGIIELNEDIFEFQSAIFCEKKSTNELLKKVGMQLMQAYQFKAHCIPTIPSMITYEKLKPLITLVDRLPIGYDYYSKKVQYYNILDKNLTSIITSDMTDERLSFVNAIIKELSLFNNLNITIIDLVEAIEENIPNVTVVKNDFEKNLVKINNEIISGLDSNNLNVYIFIGIGGFKSNLKENEIELFEHIMNLGEKLNKTKFMFIDTYFSYKSIFIDTWYLELQKNMQGIWLGENIISQKALYIKSLDSNDRNLQFPYLGYYVKDGKYKVIKHMVDYVEELDEE